MMDDRQAAAHFIAQVVTYAVTKDMHGAVRFVAHLVMIPLIESMLSS
jgi:hypothetical protein